MTKPSLLVLSLLVLCVASQQNATISPTREDEVFVRMDYYDRDSNPPHIPFERAMPSELTLRAAVLTNTVPLAYYEENRTDDDNVPFARYRGFQPDLMRHLTRIAKAFDNTTLHWNLSQAAAFSYTKHFEYIANDCNSTQNRRGGFPREDCDRFDLIIGDYYGYPRRAFRTIFTPPLLSTAAATVQYSGRQGRSITTLSEAVALKEPVCLLDESHFDDQATERFPGLVVERCYNHSDCISWLKDDRCALFVEDELQLRYLAVQDEELLVTRETFDKQYIVWPLNARLDPLLQQLIIRWIYEAKVTGVLDDLYDQYFSVYYCPLGTAGPDCEQPCSSAHGQADRNGTCVCESTKWTGADCNTRVEEDLNQIPRALRIISFLMVALNFAACGVCAVWLFVHRNSTQVRVSQPLFLCLILVGCVISTSTIFALAQEDDQGGEGPVPACMAIPWLYSVGFSITFGSLFAKIRRVFILYKAAEKAQYDMRATTISTFETFLSVTAILVLDVTILLAWTFIDPLEWTRSTITADKFGEILSSEGYCYSDHWLLFTMIIVALHLALLLLATYMCFQSRSIPTQFHEGRQLSIAMVSNLQIFVIGVPVLVIVGADPQTSFFVRSAIIWMNDLVVVTVIFGNVVWSHHKEAQIQQAAQQQREADIIQERKETLRLSTQREGTKTLVSNMLLQS